MIFALIINSVRFCIDTSLIEPTQYQISGSLTKFHLKDWYWWSIVVVVDLFDRSYWIDCRHLDANWLQPEQPVCIFGLHNELLPGAILEIGLGGRYSPQRHTSTRFADHFSQFILNKSLEASSKNITWCILYETSLNSLRQICLKP